MWMADNKLHSAQGYYYYFLPSAELPASAPAFAGIMALVNHYQSAHVEMRGRELPTTLICFAKKAGSLLPIVREFLRRLRFL